jgi:DNA processing protein
MRMAENLAFDLAGRGITVVSGMARGIDSAAHRGAIKAGGRTIAVMGSGFRNIYPRESEALAKEIAASGAVVTEFQSEVTPVKYNFPRRNRIISGLVKGVVVVEAAEKSGALITADFALNEGRDVFAVPGRADSPSSSGTNLLIKSGAKLVTCAADVIEELDLAVPGVGPCDKKNAAFGSRKGLSDDEKSVLRVLEAEDGVHIDVLAERSGLGRRVSEVLLKMEIKGLVTASAGRTYNFTWGNK